MQIVYFLFRTFVWILSRFPFFILRGIADVLYFFLFYVFKYRKKVVIENLERSFPEKSKQEIYKLAKKATRNLADIILETLKVRGMSRLQIIRHIRVTNPEVLINYFKSGRSVILVSGHCGNWEWYGPGVGLYCPGFDSAAVIVKPLSDPFFEKYITKLRSHFLPDYTVHHHHAFRTLLQRKDKVNLTLIVVDQTPHKGEIHYWTTFLNQDTAVFLGTEKMAKALNHVLIYSHIRRTRRNYYEITFELISENPKDTAEFEITQKHLRLLENDIRSEPDNWLWSHKRWKYKKPAEEPAEK